MNEVYQQLEKEKLKEEEEKYRTLVVIIKYGGASIYQ